MANVGKFILVLVAIVGLYALPNIVSDCPSGQEWSCTARLISADSDANPARLLAVSPDGDEVAVLRGADGGADQLDVWSLDTGVLTSTVEVALPDDLNTLVYSTDGSSLLVAEVTEVEDADSEVYVLNLDGSSSETLDATDGERIDMFGEAREQILDLLSDGELTVQTADGDWYVDIDTTNRWTARTASFSESRADAFILLRADSALALPRILRKHPSRIQILDIDEEEVSMDIDLPTSIVDAGWSRNGDVLVAVDEDGVLTVFGRESDL